MLRLHAQHPAQHSLHSAVYSTFRPIEIRLQSAVQYGNPYRDVYTTAEFIHSSGRRITIAAFWNGGTAHVIRFAPTLPGEWTYRTTCSDTSNRGLHRAQGTFTAQAFSSTNATFDNPLYTQGFLRVAANKQHLEYATGEPFFWLGDTAWEICWRSTKEEASRYFSVRKAQGFTAVQLVPMSIGNLSALSVRNRLGEQYFLRDRWTLNPRYFDYVDTLVQMANDSGMVAVLVPQWANGMTELHDQGWFQQMITNDQALLIARYIAARYAAHHVVWIVGGDAEYTTATQKSFWARFADTLHAASGRQHLATVHPKGLAASYDFFDNVSTPWLDFHLYQSSHQLWDEERSRILWRGYTMQPAKPVLNAEPIYEDIITNYWLSDFEAAFVGGKPRASAADVRHACYMSLMQGGKVGITYGANGIWQWNTPAMPDNSWGARYTVDSALQFPAARQMRILKQEFLRRKWHEMLPRPDILVQQHLRFRVGVLASERGIFVYLPPKSPAISLLTSVLARQNGGNPNIPPQQTTAQQGDSTLVDSLRLEWINPATGISTRRTLPRNAAAVNLIPPDNEDWLVALEPVTQPNTHTSISRMDTTALHVVSVQPASTVGAVEMILNVPSSGLLTVDVYDVRGAFVLQAQYQAARGLFVVPLGITAQGAFFYRVRLARSGVNVSSKDYEVRGKFVSY